MESIGKDTLKAMASAGQDHQVKMLQSLGLSSTLITGKICYIYVLFILRILKHQTRITKH